MPKVTAALRGQQWRVVWQCCCLTSVSHFALELQLHLQNVRTAPCTLLISHFSATLSVHAQFLYNLCCNNVPGSIFFIIILTITKSQNKVKITNGSEGCQTQTLKDRRKKKLITSCSVIRNRKLYNIYIYMSIVSYFFQLKVIIQALPSPVNTQ